MLRLNSFPAVSRSEFEAGRSYQALWQSWRCGPHEPLRVVGRLMSGYIAGDDGALHLDSVLSAAVFGCDRVGARQDNAAQFVLPLPLSLVWVCNAGRPLWAATELRPIGASNQRGECYIHSRYPADRASLADRQAVLTSAGRYKDVRIPLSVTVARAVEAWCIGIRSEVEYLLRSITHVGRKTAHGRGRVIHWSVEPANVDIDWVMERRLMPVEALGSTPIAADRIAPRMGWTPPYWDERLHRSCRVPRWTD